jgi:hypothetical protein
MKYGFLDFFQSFFLVDYYLWICLQQQNLSVTKWVHLNWGGDGLIALRFRGLFLQGRFGNIKKRGKEQVKDMFNGKLLRFGTAA